MNQAGGDENRDRSSRRTDRLVDGPETAQRLSERLLLPVANEADAETTCAAVRRYVDPQRSELVAVHVIERTPNYPDKLPRDASLERTEAIFSVVHECLEATGHRVSTDVRYGRNVAQEIFDAADAVDATAIGFTPEPESRWLKLLSGDVGHKLVTTSPRPVVVFPHPMTDLRTYFDRQRRDRDELLFDSVVLPLASVEDVETTCRAFRRNLSGRARVTVVHVVRRQERPTDLRDQELVELRQIRARRLLDRAGERLEEAGFRTETRLEYSLDVIGAIDDVAAEEEADVIVLVPRGTARWKRLLSGDVTHKLTHSMNRPIVVLPSTEAGSHSQP